MLLLGWMLLALVAPRFDVEQQALAPPFYEESCAKNALDLCKVPGFLEQGNQS